METGCSWLLFFGFCVTISGPPCRGNTWLLTPIMAKEALFLTLSLLQIPQDAAPAIGNAGHTLFRTVQSCHVSQDESTRTGRKGLPKMHRSSCACASDSTAFAL